MNALREIVQKIYYWKFYFKVKKRGRNILLSRGGSFDHAEQIIMGDNIFISNNFHISAYELTFGSNIMIGPNLVIECTNHRINTVGKTMFNEAQYKKGKAVTIEDDVWMGANVIILPGVSVSEGCVIGAGSVVTKSLPPYTVCVGTPCKPIKRRFTDIKMKEHLKIIQKSNYTIEDILNHWEKYNL